MRTLRIIRGIVKFDKDAFALAWRHVWERFKMLDEEAAEAEAATYLERRLDAIARCLEDRDTQQRQKQAIECELHLRDLRKRHMPLQDISNAVAARVRAKAGVRPGELANWLLQSRSTPSALGFQSPINSRRPAI
jgi:hypothetical protein